MKVMGSYNGTGAAVYLCLGFIPNEFHVIAGEDGDLAEGFWKHSFRCAEIADGFTMVTGTTYRQIAALTKLNGIEPYVGGDVLTSSNQTSVAYAEGIYLGWDDTDYRANTSYGCLADTIDTWTLDTAGNCTGHFNEDVVSSGSRIGEGSSILIESTTGRKRYWSVVEAVTGGQGEAADEVTLSHAVPSGKVYFISGLYSLAPIALTNTTQAGVKINNTTLINVNDEIQCFDASGSGEDKG